MWCRCVRARSAWPAPWPCSRPAFRLGAWHSALPRPLSACRRDVGAGRLGICWARSLGVTVLPRLFLLATRSATVQLARQAWACAHSLCLSPGLPVARCSLAGFVYVCRAAFGALSHVGWSRALCAASLRRCALRTAACGYVAGLTHFASLPPGCAHPARRLSRHQGGRGPQRYTVCPLLSGAQCLRVFLSHCLPRHALERARACTRASVGSCGTYAPPFLLSSFASMRNLLQCTVQCDFAASTLVFALRTRPVHKERGN